jgi:hypothetical protein
MQIWEFVPVSIAVVNDSHDFNRALKEHKYFRSVSKSPRQRYLERILVTEHMCVNHTWQLCKFKLKVNEVEN